MADRRVTSESEFSENAERSEPAWHEHPTPNVEISMHRKRVTMCKPCRSPLAETEFSCYKIDMEIKLTAVFWKFPEGYAAFVEELPGANTQGATLEEARENLKEAVAMVLQANRELAEESLHGAEVVREPLALTTA